MRKQGPPHRRRASFDCIWFQQLRSASASPSASATATAATTFSTAATASAATATFAATTAALFLGFGGALLGLLRKLILDAFVLEVLLP
jgi:hypothetical protein